MNVNGEDDNSDNSSAELEVNTAPDDDDSDDGESSSDDSTEGMRQNQDGDHNIAGSDASYDGGEKTKENQASSKVDTILEKNNACSKALRIVSDTLRSQKNGWSWAETYDVVVKSPLPFGKVAGPDGIVVSVHDDLKREVAFYDIALEAAIEAKKKCAEANIPFSRPDDFFAEMVKTDGELITFEEVKKLKIY
jgi:rRNA-processing protein EBP2